MRVTIDHKPAMVAGATQTAAHVAETDAVGASLAHDGWENARAVALTRAVSMPVPGARPRLVPAHVAPAWGARPHEPWWSACVQLLGRWTRALQGCADDEIARFPVLRAVSPLVHQARLALATSHGSQELRAWVERIENELACPLHYGVMQTPGALRCGHVFEAMWLDSLYLRNDVPFVCPTCRTPAEKIHPPEALRRLLDALHAFHARTGRPPEVLAPPPFDRTLALVPPLFRVLLYSRGSDERVRRLLRESSDIDLDVRDDRGQTALHLAVVLGYDAVVSTLLAAGAHPNVEDYQRATPLTLAIGRDNLPVVEQLLRHGAGTSGGVPPPVASAKRPAQARLLTPEEVSMMTAAAPGRVSAAPGRVPEAPTRPQNGAQAPGVSSLSRLMRRLALPFF